MPSSPFLKPFRRLVKGLEKLLLSDQISSKLFCRFLSFLDLSLLSISCFFSFSYSSRVISFSKESLQSFTKMVSTLKITYHKALYFILACPAKSMSVFQSLLLNLFDYDTWHLQKQSYSNRLYVLSFLERI